jgi:hypothetical protein
MNGFFLNAPILSDVRNAVSLLLREFLQMTDSVLLVGRSVARIAQSLSMVSFPFASCVFLSSS